MLDIGDDAFQRVAVVGISRKRLRVRRLERDGSPPRTTQPAICSKQIVLDQFKNAVADRKTWIAESMVQRR